MALVAALAGFEPEVGKHVCMAIGSGEKIRLNIFPPTA
jgi:hypothetical protein